MKIPKTENPEDIWGRWPEPGQSSSEATPKSSPQESPEAAPKTDKSREADEQAKKKESAEVPVYDIESPPDKNVAMTLPISAMFKISREAGGMYKNNVYAKLFLSKCNGTLDLFRLMAEASPNELRTYSQWIIAGQAVENVTMSQFASIRIFDEFSSEPAKIRELVEIKRICDEQARAAVALGLRLGTLPAKPVSQVQINLSAAASIQQNVNSESKIQEVSLDLSKKKEDPDVLFDLF